VTETINLSEMTVSLLGHNNSRYSHAAVTQSHTGSHASSMFQGFFSLSTAQMQCLI